jgi:nucleoid DNA-binding protein
MSKHQVLLLDLLRASLRSELQSALAEATQTDKRTAGVFLDALGTLAYKEIKKTGEFVLPGFGKLEEPGAFVMR